MNGIGRLAVAGGAGGHRHRELNELLKKQVIATVLCVRA